MFKLEGRDTYSRPVIDCTEDPGKTEQSHKQEVDINQIIKKHGMDMIAKTAKVQQLQYDDNPNNDFQETMDMIVKARESFESLPSLVRKEFGNDVARFMDFVRNPDNGQRMIDLGLAERPPEVVPESPVEVVVVQSGETPPAE
jgi:phage internal scaffolding protein